MAPSKSKLTFIEPMLLQRADALPEGDVWLYELKLDGFRAKAIKSDGRVPLRSRNDKDFSTKYPAIVQALTAMPDETVIDGEFVALDDGGPPSVLFRTTKRVLQISSITHSISWPWLGGT